MLVELSVENFAVVERLRIRFHPGLNLLTGETGSGKSLVVDALGLLLGGRASVELVRTGAERARVSGLFALSLTPAVEAILTDAGIELEEGELLVEREVLATGKSRAFAGSRPITVSLLSQIGPYLGDIHGQHDQQRLFAASNQLEMVDEFAGADELCEEVAALYRQWRRACQELEELEASEQERLRMADVWSFQKTEIEEVAPRKGEDDELEQERRVLANVADLEENVTGAHDALYESDGSAIASLRQGYRRVEAACDADPSLEPVRDSLRQAEITLEEASHELRHYLGRLEADPARLEAVENRLAALDKLKRKYGASLEEVLEFLEETRRHLVSAESAEESRERLTAERNRVAGQFEAAAAKLRKLRREAARKIEKRVEQELGSLAMERTTFRVRFDEAPWSAAGIDQVEFLVSPNPGEEPKPLDKVASGGELSRIALALKTITAQGKATRRRTREANRTLVFDEVDAGVGGSAAEAVARRLKQLSQADQVLCVTHLPQIAGFADHHYAVAKQTSEGRAVAVVEELTGTERTREIGRMLSGQTVTKEALRQAEQLIKLAAR